MSSLFLTLQVSSPGARPTSPQARTVSTGSYRNNHSQPNDSKARLKAAGAYGTGTGGGAGKPGRPGGATVWQPLRSVARAIMAMIAILRTTSFMLFPFSLPSLKLAPISQRINESALRGVPRAHAPAEFRRKSSSPNRSSFWNLWL